MSYTFPDGSSPASHSDETPSPLERLAMETTAALTVPNTYSQPNLPPLTELAPEAAKRMVDGFAAHFLLPPVYQNELRAFHQIGVSLVGEQRDSIEKIYLLSSIYASERRIIDAISSAIPKSDTGSLNELIKELTIRLEDSWQVTNEQRINTQNVCLGLVYKPKRTMFKALHLDVIEEICANAAKYNLENVISRPSRKDRWAKLVKRLASNARNTLRQQIRDSVFGEKRCTVEQFTKDQSIRYRVSGNDQGFLLQNILMRRFARENAGLLDREEDEESTSDAENILDDAGKPAKKRKRTRGRGRISEGDDYWGKMDSWFADKIDAFGEPYKTAEWKDFIDESVKLDQAESTPKGPMPNQSSTDPLGTITNVLHPPTRSDWDLAPITPSSGQADWMTALLHSSGRA